MYSVGIYIYFVHCFLVFTTPAIPLSAITAYVPLSKINNIDYADVLLIVTYMISVLLFWA